MFHWSEQDTAPTLAALIQLSLEPHTVYLVQEALPTETR